MKETKKGILMLASVASMIDLFNEDNISIMEKLGCRIDVAANFQEGSITSQKRVDEYHDELVERGIKVYDIPFPRSIFKIGQIVKSYMAVKKIARENKYVLAHVHSPIGGVVGRLALRKARHNNTKVIYTAHGFHFFDGAPLLNWLVYYPIERLCAHFTDVIITINQEDYRRASGWNVCEVKYVPGIGVDTQVAIISAEERRRVREEFGFTDRDFVFMSTGQVSVRKNHEVIIKALSKIDDPSVKYLIVGFGEEEARLKQMAKALGVEQRVVFAGYRGDVKQLLKVVEAFAFPSLQEGLPVALMEAMAAGLPIVCSRIRGNVDLVEDGQGGYLFDAHDTDGFVSGMRKIITNANASKMGLINEQMIKKFDRNVVSEYMERIYSELMGGGKTVVSISQACYAKAA